MSDVVVLFPPRAGVNAERLLALRREFEPVREMLDVVGRLLGVQTDRDSLALRTCAKDGFCGQFLELGACLGLYRSLCACGVQPSAVAVHCLGVYTALIAAGCTSLEQGFALLRSHVECVLGRAGELTTVLQLPVGEVEAFCALDGGIEVSTYNGDRHCTVSGPAPALARLESWARARGGKSRRLQGFGGWHYSGNQQIRGELLGLAERHIEVDAQLPLWFPLPNPRRVTARADVIAAVVDQAVAPVCWRAFLHGWLSVQAAHCIEVGPARPLSQFQQPHANDSIELLSFQTTQELDQLIATLRLEQRRAAHTLSSSRQ